MIRNLQKQLLSNNWYKLWKYTFEQQMHTGEWASVAREAYDRGNGAAVLLYDPSRQTVVLTRQFRLPTYVNGNADGMMIEACAGLLDEADPAACARREAEEETGYVINKVEKVMEVYTSPGSVTEILYLFVAEYSNADKQYEGGGLATEHEDIEVLEMPFAQAMAMVKTGEIRDAKTILLLQHLALQGTVNK